MQLPGEPKAESYLSGGDLLQSMYARLVNPAGPMDGRGDARPHLLPAAGPGAVRHQRPDGWPRGLALFFVLVAAVVVRETARLLVAAWLGLRLRAVLLLPIGGLFAYANPESQENANGGRRAVCSRRCRAAGELGCGPHRCRRNPGRQRRRAALRPIPSSTPAHLLRSLVWMQAFLGCFICCPPIRSIAAG